MNSLKKIFKDIDGVFLAICILCSTLSVISIFSISLKMGQVRMTKVVVQLAASVLGVAIALIISQMDYKEMCELWKLHSVPAYRLMVLTAIIGFAPPGTTNKAWIELPFGLTLQPSEILKVSTIVTLAYFLDKYRGNLNEIKTLAKAVGIACVPMAFVAFQRDGGTLIVYAVMIAAMFFVAGISYKVIALCAGLACAAFPVMWAKDLIGDYQKNRILGLFDPEKYSTVMWQQTMGRISIGSGQILGKGFLVDNHNATPLAYNDFIFSFMAESLGFVGTVALLALIVFMWLRIISIARRCADGQGTFICIGVLGMLIGQTFINVGMNLMLLPCIGVTLPLFSAGGSSTVVTYCAMGLVMCVAKHNPKTLFNTGI